MNHTDTIPFLPEERETIKPPNEEPITPQVEELIEQGELDLLDILDRAFESEQTKPGFDTIPQKESF